MRRANTVQVNLLGQGYSLARRRRITSLPSQTGITVVNLLGVRLTKTSVRLKFDPSMITGAKQWLTCLQGVRPERAP